MAVRVGVDVGGTFTKAVACDAGDGRIVARAVVPTTHQGIDGVAAGVAEAIDRLAATLAADGTGPILLVGHSTTQAVNALLEGDTATVGVLGIGRRPDLDRIAARTRLRDVRVAPGHALRTVAAVVDATDGLDRGVVEAALLRLRDAGAEAICVSEAFSIEDPSGERFASAIAADLGLPACAGHELSGLYGLEMRTVTAALNASILPGGLRTGDLVAAAVERVAPDAPLLVMRGDGGAVEQHAVRRHPLLTAFSGPAASVVGALRHLALTDAVVVEVGGTSTNVSVVRGGRPLLAYVRVMDHVTHVRSLDVRVGGVAGGSLVRLRRGRLGRWAVEDVGPRSAHIAGLPYAAFTPAADLVDATAVLEAPRPGDLEDHAVIRTTRGERVAVTVTCAANALGGVEPGSHATGDRESARLALEALGRLTGTPWDTLARRVLDVAAQKVGRIIGDLVAESGVRQPAIVGLGGGAGALLPAIGKNLGLPVRIPADAEVISSVGDALSLVRVEQEHSVRRGDTAAVAAAHRAVEDAAIAAGADPDGLLVESEVVSERSAVRVVAVGAYLLDGVGTQNGSFGEADPVRAAGAALGGPAHLVAETTGHLVFTGGRNADSFVVVDRRGAVVASGRGEVLTGSADDVAARLRERVPDLVRGFGPIAVAPAVRVLRGSRLIDLSLFSSPDQVLAAAVEECEKGAGQTVAAVLSRE